MLFEFDDLARQKAKMRVVGIGGAGGNAINRMINAQLSGVEFIAVNTDAQALDNNLADVKLQIGKQLTKGLGAGANLEIGRDAAEEDQQAVSAVLDGADMIFITAGMGGGTGTGAAPVIAKIAKEQGALTVGIVTTPFRFEGPLRTKRALEGIQYLKDHVDTLIVIPNQRLLEVVERGTSITEAFLVADSVLHQATKGISDLINIHGLINLDFADVKTIMSGMGDAIMGTGQATGEERAVLAAQSAISSPLLNNTDINGARGLLVNVTGGPDLSLMEVDEAMNIIYDEVGEEANIIFGAVIDEEMEGQISVTIIATGFNQESVRKVEEKRDEPKIERRPDFSYNDQPAIATETPVNGDAAQASMDKQKENYLDVPAYKRRIERQESGSESKSVTHHFGDDFVIPEFSKRPSFR
ncbi:MAG: cell division protein FtsZ [Candidatus Marinimicrobia bacterium]|nr:cell division protein FtsZ [Candidatus Neomarinimicrobiota bacterium]MCF7839319.1 cell division protein FtsZ [Candidatus Neomarinimicrobiota bacterium]